MARDHLIDGAKASPLMGYVAAFVGGLPIAEWAQWAALIYSLILIYDKLKQMGLFRWMARRLHL